MRKRSKGWRRKMAVVIHRDGSDGSNGLARPPAWHPLLIRG